MDQKLKDALLPGGTYIFLVRVQKENNQTTVMREDKITLGKDDILEKENQDELEDYLKKNHVIKVSLNGEEVWKSSGIIIDCTDQFGRMY